MEYVIPPFTPGGRVNVAFQFWVPLSVGGFFITAKEMREAMKSSNPNAYLAKVFVENLKANLTSHPTWSSYVTPQVNKLIIK